MTEKTKKLLTLKAARIRQLIVEAVYSASSGHPGGSLSIADVLTYWYLDKMNVNVNDAKNADRDRFVLSKGHTTPALYSTLAVKGFFPEDEIKNFRQTTSFLQGHPDIKKVPGVDMTTGSLGQGISAACGMALSAKYTGKSYKVYAALGDGEIQEGQVWEAAMFAAHYKLSNLTAFVDFNGLQIDGAIVDVMNPTPIDKKFEAFGWDVQVIDGHSFEEIEKAVQNAEKSDKPSVIICKTIKGKGVSFMENKASWHGSAPNAEQYAVAKSELDETYNLAKEAYDND